MITKSKFLTSQFIHLGDDDKENMPYLMIQAFKRLEEIGHAIYWSLKYEEKDNILFSQSRDLSDDKKENIPFLTSQAFTGRGEIPPSFFAIQGFQ